MAKGGFKTNGRRGPQQIALCARTRGSPNGVPCLWRRRQPEMNVSRARLASACRGDHFNSGENKLKKCRIQEMQGKVSPKNTACEHCGRFFTARGVKEHVRHHCPANPHRRKRVFTKSKCLHCGKRMHSAGLRRVQCLCAPREVRPFAFCESTPRTGKAKEKRSEGSRAPLKRVAPAGLGESCPPCPIKGAEKNFSRKQKQGRATESHLEGGREARSRRATWQCDVAAA